MSLLFVNFTAQSQMNEDTLRIIEQKYGEQWDFCTCVVKNDSINKALLSPNLSDDMFEDISERFDYVETKCMAFLVMYKRNTPEDRLAHAQRVKDCLNQEEDNKK